MDGKDKGFKDAYDRVLLMGFITIAIVYLLGGVTGFLLYPVIF